MTTDKKVVVDRDGRQVSKQGDAADPVAVTMGDTVTHTIDVTVPNTAVKFKLADAPAGQEYVKGSLKVALSGTATDVTADTVIYDGETQHGAENPAGRRHSQEGRQNPGRPGYHRSGRRLGSERHQAHHHAGRQEDHHHLPERRHQGHGRETIRKLGFRHRHLQGRSPLHRRHQWRQG
ncbi:isopeptide-forming domain-containing fimbrial protein [Bifidobacterium longum]|uniref:isopeptide-forming domain-containing fimbrial protein n=1 Tax=Bifidobacterium longum TaxID=216816 RepID=UPI001F621744|nr:isopeptide-forming domain-containing fimbrial protein [Bifidobacterium longum]